MRGKRKEKKVKLINPLIDKLSPWKWTEEYLHIYKYHKKIRRFTVTNLVVGLDGAQLHHQLKAQQVVRSDGLQFQEFTQGHQLGALQVLQGQLILKQLGELHNVLCAGLLTCVPHLHTQNTLDMSPSPY